MLCVETNKDDVDNSTLFRKRMYKLESSHFHRRVRRSNVHRGISAGTKMPFVTYHAHTTIPKLELQAGVYGIRFRWQILREHDVRIERINDWTASSTV